jgi:hypothetical protein
MIEQYSGGGSMKKPADRIALALSFFTTLVFALNILILPAIPFLLSLRYNFTAGSQTVFSFLPLEKTALTGYLLTLCFYFLCGTCSAYLLWQGRGLLTNIANHRPFAKENARYMLRASKSLYIISALALVRAAIWLTYMSFAQVLMAYNTLFVPLFFIAGLLFRILAELFSEASDIKEENDLTI